MVCIPINTENVTKEVYNLKEGEIVKLVRHRGFGFINSGEDDIKEDIFFHHSSLQDLYFEDLEKGDKLKFELKETPKGPEAINIQKKIDVSEFEIEEELVEEEELEEIDDVDFESDEVMV